VKKPPSEVKESVWKAEEQPSGWRPSRRLRISVVLAVGAALLITAFVFKDYNRIKPVEIQAVAEAGTTRIQLSGGEMRPMSPGCGCLNPSFGAHDWFGVSLPSTGFDMSVVPQGSDPPDRQRWALTAMSPELAPIDYYETPNHSLFMRVTAGGYGHERVLYAGRTTYSLAVTSGQVEVGHGHRFPYAALLPAADGPVEIESEPGVRSDFGSSMNVRAFAPSREKMPDYSEIRSEREYLEHTELTQRGPMVDVLGPVMRMTLRATPDLELYAGYRKIDGFRDGESVVVTLRTPFAIRLFPQLADSEWAEALTSGWGEIVAEAKEGDKEAIHQVDLGPALIGRMIDDTSSPPYSLRLRGLAVPPSDRWKDFAATSSDHGEVRQMLGNIEPDGSFSTLYQLPPVRPNVEVGVFGPMTKLETSSMHGQVFTDGKAVVFGRGQSLSVESENGLATGRYQMTPLISAGPPTEQANAAGDAKISIGGAPVNTLPFLPVLLGAIAVILLGLALEAFVRWGVRPS
jgi:hypothetical protein